jgi:hypothetical protein
MEVSSRSIAQRIEQAGSGIQVRILSSAGFARAAQNPYLFRTTSKPIEPQRSQYLAQSSIASFA